MSKKISDLQCYLVGYPEFSAGAATFVFKKLNSEGRILRKKYVVQRGTHTPDWVRSKKAFTAVNDALKFFGFGFQLHNIAFAVKNGRYFFYDVFNRV